ncbi:MAG TPA: ABC transporter permease subunit [Caulobacteraceae bacterium]|nr:ABC transporter permease subunit [Caulobacteraceae bacterium]
MIRVLRAVAPALALVALLGLWEGLCRGLGVLPSILPPPSAIGLALVQHFPLLMRSAWNTFAMALIALAVASAVATSLAIGAVLSGVFERSLRPLVVAVQVTPVVALAPLIQIWAGIDHPGVAEVALAAVVAFFPIYSGALSGLRAVDPDLERLFNLYGAGAWQRLVRLRLPSAVPFLLEGHKVAVGLALVGAVVAEFGAGAGSASGQGLAWRILEANHKLQTDRAMAALLVLAAMGAALYSLFQGLERRALAWWRGR